ncbi:MAG: undecaprenyl/decaprenyl-phosphate alpha-N-acetylglucosaminyl 1-phosphate transferase [Fluviicola sp.]|nr:undecaprenyl/decaprenyl-phosphate alpha-N-acetylglucosaminyl 1-phosphate transferase [Fluviicola sp.]
MTAEIIIACLAFVGGGIIASLVCNELLLRFSQSLGIRNKNDVVVRWANESKPSLGGVAFFIAFVFGAIAYSIVFQNENIFHNKEFVGLMAAGVLAFVMGLSDDAYNTKPLVKLVVQISCGVILVYTNTIIPLSGIFWVDGMITVIWVVGIMNSLNMLDNMDGITGTTVLFILFSCLASDIILFDWNMNIWTLTLCIQIGAILGFLRFNINPSKLFMGDAGSQFIGLFAAFFSIHDLWTVGVKTQLNPLVGMAIVLIAFTPAAVDTFTVVINRLKKGQSPMVGGKDHTTHHLVYAGLNDKQVWLVFLLIAFLSTIITILAIIFAKWGNPWMGVFLTLYFFVVFFILYRNTIIHKR